MNLVGQGIVSLCDMMGAAIGPLIFMVIGYGLRFACRAGTDVLWTLLTRFALAAAVILTVSPVLV